MWSFQLSTTMKLRPLHLGCALVLSLVLASAASAQFAELTKKIPASANVAVFVNAEKLMASPVAIKEGWDLKRDKAYASGVTFLPPDAKHAVLAMELDLQNWVPMWESAVIDLDHKPDINQVVAMTGGAPDTIEGYQVVALPSDCHARASSLLRPATLKSPKIPAFFLPSLF